MAFDAEKIRETAQRVAASHGLDVVELEFSGGAKHRILRVFIEKDPDERKRLADQPQPIGSEGDATRPGARSSAGTDQLALVTHEDCESFSRDFGVVLDVEDLIPGGEYTLEVSSPGLDRKLHGIEDYRRFSGMLVKLQTFEPIAGNRHWQGRLREVDGDAVRVTPEGRGQKRSKRKTGSEVEATEDVVIPLRNIEKAQLVPEF